MEYHVQWCLVCEKRIEHQGLYCSPRCLRVDFMVRPPNHVPSTSSTSSPDRLMAIPFDTIEHCGMSNSRPRKAQSVSDATVDAQLHRRLIYPRNTQLPPTSGGHASTTAPSLLTFSFAPSPSSPSALTSAKMLPQPYIYPHPATPLVSPESPPIYTTAPQSASLSMPTSAWTPRSPPGELTINTAVAKHDFARDAEISPRPALYLNGRV
ncbi:hypothetical protein BC829DRAFT_388189 [Chytridium lagenaria]|nr:hypothetical protein BC829DRAFT_388189 [Chytridium lagenaria]